MSTEQERADFEAFASKHGLCVTEDGDLYRSQLVAWMWKAWQARAALQSQDREDAQEIAATLATVLHFIPRKDDPELYADVERLCGKFGDHARRVEGDGE